MRKLENKRCPVCGGPIQMEPLLTYFDLPVFVNALSDTAEHARAAACGTQRLVLCPRCGFVFNQAFEPEKMRYTTEYHTERDVSPAFLQHVQSVLDLIASVEPMEGKRLLEVACGTGEFLQEAAKRGLLKRVGVDPSSENLKTGNLEIHQALFDEAYLLRHQEQIHILINRHMIEHILSPLEMLRLFAKALPRDGLLYLETPRLDWILRNQVFFDFPYEHCAYYTDDFIRRLLTAAGFSIASIRSSYKGQYFSICARKRNGPSKIEAADSTDLAKVKNSFLEIAKIAFSNLDKRESSRLSRILPTNGVYLWGAAAKGVMCANLLKNVAIDGCVDKNPNKQGKFIPGTAHPVIAPKDIAFPRVQVVLVENEMYLEEVRLEVEKIDSRIKVYSLHQMLNIGTDTVGLFQKP